MVLEQLLVFARTREELTGGASQSKGTSNGKRSKLISFGWQPTADRGWIKRGVTRRQTEKLFSDTPERENLSDESLCRRGLETTRQSGTCSRRHQPTISDATPRATIRHEFSSPPHRDANLRGCTPGRRTPGREFYFQLRGKIGVVGFG